MQKLIRYAMQEINRRREVPDLDLQHLFDAPQEPPTTS
jgi:hypothetical protein